jgi:hypothetical protein
MAAAVPAVCVGWVVALILAELVDKSAVDASLGVEAWLPQPAARLTSDNMMQAAVATLEVKFILGSPVECELSRRWPRALGAPVVSLSSSFSAVLVRLLTDSWSGQEPEEPYKLFCDGRF